MFLSRRKKYAGLSKRFPRPSILAAKGTNNKQKPVFLKKIVQKPYSDKSVTVDWLS